MAEFDFIVPFRARSTAKDWPSVCSLLAQTLASVWNSSDSRFRVLVVCHEVPPIDVDLARCEFLQVDFAAPAAATIGWDSERRYFSWMSDKGRKVLWGLRRSRADASRYFMVLDADDLLSSRVVAYCLERDHASGYYFRRGFRMDERSPGWLCRRGRFHEECGSSIVLRTDIAPFPAVPDFSRDLDDHYIRRYVRHGYLPGHLAKEGHPLDEIPFRAGIYRFHEENAYAGDFRRADTWLRQRARNLLTGQPLTNSLRNEFAIGATAGS